jgi:VRR-NUC domain
MERTKETVIQAAICEYLTFRGYFFSRTNNMPVFEKGRGVFRALPKYTRKGWPDICLLIRGIFWAIEVKTEDGKLSPEQEQMKSDIEANGGRYLVARSIDDIQAAGL